jgi:hypothetical protein
MKRDPSDKAADTAMVLAVLAHYNIPTDIQELLIRGDPMRDIAPGALSNAIESVIEFYAIAYAKERP